MEKREYLFYGFGQVCYALAMSDGKVQKSEHDDLVKLLKDEFEILDIDFDVLEISFELMFRDGIENSDEAYSFGLKNMEMGKNSLNEELMAKFNRILMNVADSYKGVDTDEMNFIRQFNKDMDTMVTS
ncbi:MAG: hypothetical protein KDC84_09590 [Crocinitomicaceae bacterium]|nr:hypothetical protein [Crocinitomicaceae bacterium]